MRVAGVSVAVLTMDVTEWFAWFLDTLHRAVDQAQHTLNAVLTKARFWQRWATTSLIVDYSIHLEEQLSAAYIRPQNNRAFKVNTRFTQYAACSVCAQSRL